MSDLIGGQLDGLFGDGPTVMPQVAGGRIKTLAALSTRRSVSFPTYRPWRNRGLMRSPTSGRVCLRRRERRMRSSSG